MATSDSETQPRREQEAKRDKFPVVGIGASAGGVQALQNFFEALPGRMGVAFVVIVHLDPDAQSDLPHIISSRTQIPVVQVSKSQQLEPDHVYVIPPNRRLRVTDGIISALEFEEPRGRRAPIDLFFRSLADQHGDGFAIILTGAGSDGVVGIKAMKESGGIILVQDVKDAEHPSMPRNAIATGLADFVAPVRELATCLVELVNKKKEDPLTSLKDGDDETLRRVLSIVHVRTGNDFAQYKRSTLQHLRNWKRAMRNCNCPATSNRKKPVMTGIC